MLFSCKNIRWNTFFFKATKNMNTFPINFYSTSFNGIKCPTAGKAKLKVYNTLSSNYNSKAMNSFQDHCLKVMTNSPWRLSFALHFFQDHCYTVTVDSFQDLVYDSKQHECHWFLSRSYIM